MFLSVTAKIWLSSPHPQVSLHTAHTLIISAYLYYLSFSSPLRGIITEPWKGSSD